jgi:acyl-CoA thioesterase FadM
VSNPDIDIARLPHVLRREVPPEYVDRMEHVGVAAYGTIFADAAWAFLGCVGMTPEHFRSNRSGTFALEQHIKFFQEIRAEEVIDVYARPLSRSARRLHYALVLMKPEQKLSAVAEYVNIYIDMDSRKPREFPPEIVENIDRCISVTNIELSRVLCGVMRA